MKRIFKGLLILLSVFLFNLSAYANVGTSVYYEGNRLTLSTEPVIVNNVTMVPLRDIFEPMSYSLIWQADTKTITGFNHENILQLQVGNPKAYLNGHEFILTVPPTISNGYTLVPLRFVAESSGSVVEWDESTHSVHIYSQDYYQKVSQQNLKYGFNVEAAKKTVVTVYADEFQGSGVIVSDDGYIVTNFHVVEGTNSIYIRFSDGQMYKKDLHIAAYDSVNDIAILKIDASSLPFAQIGNSDLLKEGDKVTAIGSPNGIPNTVTQGNIIFSDRYTITSSAEIDHGSSGGGIFNENGEVVGITTAFTDYDYSVIVPINIAADLPIDNLIDLKNWIAIKPELAPPDDIRFIMKDGDIYIGWSRVYLADYYKIYTSSSSNGTFEVMKDSKGRTTWNWGVPFSIKITNPKDNNLYVKITSIKDGKESSKSQAVSLVLYD